MTVNGKKTIKHCQSPIFLINYLTATLLFYLVVTLQKPLDRRACMPIRSCIIISAGVYFVKVGEIYPWANRQFFGKIWQNFACLKYLTLKKWVIV